MARVKFGMKPKDAARNEVGGQLKDEIKAFAGESLSMRTPWSDHAEEWNCELRGIRGAFLLSDQPKAGQHSCGRGHGGEAQAEKMK